MLTALAVVLPALGSSFAAEPVEFDSHRYELFEEFVSWQDAVASCEEIGAHLVTIGSAEENEFVWNQFGDNYHWLGATDEECEGEWRWVTDEPFDYTNWMPGEPNNCCPPEFCGGNDCTPEHYLAWGSADGRWNDVPNGTLVFICEWDDTPPMEAKAASVSTLQGMLPTGDSKADKSIEKAIAHVEESLTPDWWMDDFDLDPKNGKKVFANERRAVKELTKKHTQGIAEIQVVVDALVSADQALAQRALDAATEASGDPRDLSKALKEMAKAAKELEKGRPDKAIDHYGKAWKKAQKAISKRPAPLVIWMESTFAGALADAVEHFTMDTGIEVVVETFDEFDIRNLLFAAAENEVGPDIFLGAHGWAGGLAEIGLIEPIDLTSVAPAFAPVALEAMLYEGEHWALPISIEAIALVYNKDLVGTPPSTFEGLGPSCAGMAGIEHCVGLSMGDPYHHYPFLTAFGGYVFGFDPANGWDPSDVGLDTGGATAGAEFLEGQVKAGVIGGPPASAGSYQETVDLFLDGAFPYWPTGPWSVGALEGSGMNWGVVPIPAMNGNVPGPFVGVQGFFLGVYGQQEAAAKYLLEYVATTETMVALYNGTHRPPVHLGAYGAVAAEATEVFITSAASGEPMPNIPEMGFAWTPMADAFDAIRTGALPAAEAMTQAAQAVRAAIGN